MFPGPLGASLAGRALDEGIWSLDATNIRDFATDKHRSVDDTPAGGGAGMVLRPDVLAAAIDSVADGRPMLALTPRGAPLTQARVRELAAGEGVILLCGRFEGFDERIFDARPIEQVSIGDYVLSGGELGAMVILDACVRLLPGVMGAASSGEEESFETGLLEYPHYTRPVTWEGRTIPEVLRSGDHAKIAAWRHERAVEDTRLRRPDLIERHGGASQAPPSGARRRDRRQKEMNLIETLEREAIDALTADKPIPEFRPGDTLRVGVKVIEGDRTRVQNFEGVCIARANKGVGSSFTVRKIQFGEGVERVFPLYSPIIDTIEVVRRGDVRRAKLYYLRGRTGKAARIAERRDRPARRSGGQAAETEAPAAKPKPRPQSLAAPAGDRIPVDQARVEVPGRIAEPRQDEGEPDEQRDRAEHQQRRHVRPQRIISPLLACAARHEADTASRRADVAIDQHRQRDDAECQHDPAEDRADDGAGDDQRPAVEGW